MIPTKVTMSEEVKVIVFGSRGFDDYELLADKMNGFLMEVFPIPITVVSGCANGADKLGEEWARFTGLNIKRFPADWNKYGKKAGYIRNKQMAEYGDYGFGFWDGVSTGTGMMIKLCNEHNVKLRIIKYNSPKQ